MEERSSIFCVVACLAVLVMVAGTFPGINAEEENVIVANPGDKGPYNCMKLVMRGAKSVVKVLSACTKKVKATTKDNVEFGGKMGCVMKCALHDANITTPDYHITADSLLPLMHQIIPNAFMVHELHTFLWRHCEHTAAQLDPVEERCLSYGDFVSCLLSTFEEFMNMSPYCIKRKKKQQHDSEPTMEVSIGG